MTPDKKSQMFKTYKRQRVMLKHAVMPIDIRYLIDLLAQTRGSRERVPFGWKLIFNKCKRHLRHFYWILCGFRGNTAALPHLKGNVTKIQKQHTSCNKNVEFNKVILNNVNKADWTILPTTTRCVSITNTSRGANSDPVSALQSGSLSRWISYFCGFHFVRN